MASLNPVELLKHELDLFEKSLKKSKESFQKDEIDIDTHMTHRENLEPIIYQYKRAIEILTFV